MTRARGSSRRGLTLAEAVISIVLVGVMLVAAINTLGASKAGQQVIRDQRIGHHLAEQLMAEILSHPYHDESQLEFLKEEVLVWGKPTAVTLGPEFGETGTNRLKFDDIDDYDRWSSSPPEDASGKPIAGAEAYRRTVAVSLGGANDAFRSVTQEEGTRRIVVTVLRAGVEVDRLESVVALGPTPTQACFLPDGSCADLPASVCAELGGVAQGSGSRCAVDAPAFTAGTNTLPIHHWAMDEGSGSLVADSASGIDLAIVGTPSAMWKNAVVDGGLYFNGSTRARSTLKIIPPQAATVAFWMRSPGRPTEEGGVLTVHSSWRVRSMPSGSGDGVPGGLVFDLGLKSRNWGQPEFATSVPLDEPGRWYHVAATYDATAGTYAVYIDGVEDVSGTGSFDMPGDKVMTIGEKFEGVLDDMRIYDYELTTEEIAALVVPAPPPGVQFAGFSEDKAVSNSTALNKWPPPAGTADGDLLIATVVTDGNTKGTHDPPLGWTLLAEEERYSEVTVAVFWKIAAAEPADYKFQWDDREEAYGFMSRITGADPAAPIESVSILTTGSDVTFSPPSPSATSSVDGVLVLRLGGFDDDDITINNPGLPAHHVITMDKSSAGTRSASGGAGYRMLLGAGSTGSSSFSLTDMEQTVAITVLIKPAPSLEVGP